MVKLLYIVIQKIENLPNEIWDLSNNIFRQTAEQIRDCYYLHTDKFLHERKFREITDHCVGKFRWSTEGPELLG